VKEIVFSSVLLLEIVRIKTRQLRLGCLKSISKFQVKRVRAGVMEGRKAQAPSVGNHPNELLQIETKNGTSA
jgi:hypothetical protein